MGADVSTVFTAGICRLKQGNTPGLKAIYSPEEKAKPSNDDDKTAIGLKALGVAGIFAALAKKGLLFKAANLSAVKAAAASAAGKGVGSAAVFGTNAGTVGSAVVGAAGTGATVAGPAVGSAVIGTKAAVVGSAAARVAGTGAGVAVGSAVIGAKAATAGLAAVGFTVEGVVAAGSVAAAIQAWIGNVAAGSFFASSQAVGANGGFAVFGPVGLAAGVVGVGIFVGLRYYISGSDDEHEACGADI